MKNKVNRVKDPNQFYRASMIAHVNGEFAKQRMGWHGGDIHQTGAFGDVGIIIDPAYDGLVQIAWNCDMGSPNDPKELERYVQQHKGKIRDPLTLLTKTIGLDNIKYNELILRGDEGTVVKGVFFIPYTSKTERKGRQLGEIVSELMQTDVPIIELPASPIEKYENIEDPNKRELMRTVKNLQALCEIMQTHSEFCQPELVRNRCSLGTIGAVRYH